MRVSGQYDAKLDGKGRVIVPAAYRHKIPPNAEMRLLIAPEFDDRDAIFFCEEQFLLNWAKDIHQKLRDGNSPGGRSAANRIVSLFVGRARDTQIDSQGRLLLPQDLRQACGIEKEVRFIGSADVIEIWKPATHDKWVGDVIADIDEETRALISFGGFLQTEFQS